MAGPFKMRSGNSPLFKQMGSSPAKVEIEGVKRDPKKDTTKHKEKEPTLQQGGTPPGLGGYSGDDEGKTIWESKPKVEPKSKPKSDPKVSVKMPKDHPVTPPSEKEKETSKGTLKGVTQFEQDIVNPTKDIILTAAEDTKRKMIDPAKAISKKMVEADKKKIKAIKDYFTKR